MILALRDFIQQHRTVSIEQVSRAFRIEPDALRPMLAIWIRKGLMREMGAKKRCGVSCQGCQTKSIIYYEWCLDKTSR